MPCDSCGKKINLADTPPLNFTQCPNCGSQNFVPYNIKDFWLYRPLGGGGMGSVYKGVHQDQGDIVAVKILPRDKRDDEYLVNALMKEAETGAAFNEHPNIALVYDYGESNGEHFMATEFVQGIRLDEFIDSTGHTDQSFVILWGLQILSALQHMYDRGFLYRDMKPQNVIIDTDMDTRIFDFGLCMDIYAAANADESSPVEGSPKYMPPERLVGAGEGMYSEIYSLGMVLFHTLSKTSYYSATTAIDLAKKHVVSLRLASVASRLPKDCDPRLVRILDKMISRVPADRYQTYEQVYLELNEVYNSIVTGPLATPGK